MILVTKTSDQTRQRGHTLSTCTNLTCVCVCVVPFILDVRLVDAPAGVTQEEDHTGFLHLPSAVLALAFIARRIQSSLSLVDREVEFLCTHLLIVLRFVGHDFYFILYFCEETSQFVLPVFQNLNYKLQRRQSGMLPIHRTEL